MRIMFMGTPEIAKYFLEAVAKKHDVCCAVTQPDKPRGRGHKVTPCETALKAKELGIDVVTPTTFKDNAFLNTLEKYNPEMIVVVAYGRILPKYVLDYPKYGCINVHASLLPKFRGAAPINQAIIEGEKVSGVTTMLMAEGLDTGDILLTKEIEITDSMTAGELYDKICLECPPLLLETIENINSIVPIKQDETKATYCGLFNKDNTRIDWNKTDEEIINFIRGLNPFPTAYTMCSGKKFKIYNACKCNAKGDAGKICCDNGKIIVYCKNGAVEITELQPESKKRMKACDYLNGYSFSDNAYFE